MYYQLINYLFQAELIKKDSQITDLQENIKSQQAETSKVKGKLTTALIHNTGLGRTPVTFLPDVPLRQIAESKGYTVTWNAADGSTTITKGAVSYTITPEEYTCKVAGGEDIELTHYAYVNDGVTYIPMDFADTL